MFPAVCRPLWPYSNCSAWFSNGTVCAAAPSWICTDSCSCRPKWCRHRCSRRRGWRKQQQQAHDLHCGAAAPHDLQGAGRAAEGQVNAEHWQEGAASWPGFRLPAAPEEGGTTKRRIAAARRRRRRHYCHCLTPAVAAILPNCCPLHRSCNLAAKWCRVHRFECQAWGERSFGKQSFGLGPVRA